MKNTKKTWLIIVICVAIIGMGILIGLWYDDYSDQRIIDSNNRRIHELEEQREAINDCMDALNDIKGVLD